MKKTIKDILKVTLSNLFVLLAGVAGGLLIPKILSVEGYGNYKIFTLYLGYFGVLSLGFIDGIYLKYSGIDFEDLDHKKYKLFFKYYLFFQIIFNIILIIITFILKDEYRNIFALLSIYFIPYMIICYMQQISQITQRFSELSIIKIINSILLFVAIMSLFIIYKSNNNQLIDYKIYIYIFVIVNFFVCLLYIWIYRKIIFGVSIPFKDGKKEIFEIHKIGLPLLLANFVINLIILIDRQFVSVLFDRETYSIYSFAYNILSLVTTAISAVAIVIYPKLKLINDENRENIYTKLSTIIIIVFSAIFLSYYPLKYFISWFLPNYISSMDIFKIIFPSLLCTSLISIIIFNYYKVYFKLKQFFFFSIIILCFIVVANYISYNLFKTTSSISYASTISIVIWYVIVDIYITKKLEINDTKNIIGTILLIIIFYCSQQIDNIFISIFLYLLISLVSMFFLYRKDIVEMKSLFFKKDN